MTKYLFLFCFGFFLSYLYIVHPFSLDQFHTFAESFQAIALGIAAIIGSYVYIPELYRGYQRALLTRKYRQLYRADKLNEDYFLTSFGGYVVLFDLLTNKYHHIVPFETAKDLQFVDQWNYVDKKFPPDPEYLLQKGGSNHFFKFNRFSYGLAINTQV